MSALAQAIRWAGYRVTGSDRYGDEGRDLKVLTDLAAAGIEIVPQDGSGVRRDTRGVVVSTAIESGNPDLSAAAQHGVRVLHRSEMLAELLVGKRCVAVTGTSGKTTVTGMVGWILQQLGLDPTVVNGGTVLNWAVEDRIGNARQGRSDLWVIEADESDRSLLRYSPDWAVVTNVSRDHFSLEETEALFRDFKARVKRGVVEPLVEAGGVFRARVGAEGSEFEHGGRRFRTRLLGRHNAENALQAVRLCARMGLDLDGVAHALESFQGIARRLEVVGRVGGITVVDDYAHNTAKIRAALETMQPLHVRILCAWRPHGFTPLANMKADLVRMFADMLRPQDRLLVLPVFYAGGTANRAVDSEAFVQALRQAAVPAVHVPTYDTLCEMLCRTAAPGDAVLIMGARDPDLPAFARRVCESLRLEAC